MKAGHFSVKGFHEAARLQNILDDFIKEFVLCHTCTNPETLLTVLETVITVW